MKLQHVFFAALLGTALATTACAQVGDEPRHSNKEKRNNSDQKSETRELKSFNKVEINGIGNAVIKKGDSFQIVVTTDADYLTKVQTEVNGATLKIDTKGSWSGDYSVNYLITTHDLEGVEVAGVAKVTVEPGFSPSNLNLEMSGVGSFTGTFNAKNIKAEVSGAGKIVLKGTADEIKGDVSGAGKVEADQMVARKANVQVSGVGSFTVNATDDLVASVDGTGTVKYKGNPAHLSKNVSGVGNIKPL
jgi:hypothetical protein